MHGWHRRWILRESSGDGPPGGLVERILRARAIDDVAGFLEPTMKGLRDPADLPGAEDVAARLLDALRRDRPIVVYGDYDVDGVTATAILVHVLRHLEPQARVRTVVPHRLVDGYGLNAAALEAIATSDDRATVVTVDCGVSAIEEASLARRLGLELLITDHHEPVRSSDAPDAPPTWPVAEAIAHPMWRGRDGVGDDASAPSDGSSESIEPLCGAGVAFKVAWALLRRARGVSDRLPATDRELLLELMGYAALGTVADLVPLVGENRVIAANGLRVVGRMRHPGLQALVHACGLTPGTRVTSEQVGFRLGPHLNAVGRLGHADRAVRLLCDAASDEAIEIAGELARLNDERRRLCDTITREAEDAASASGQLDPSHRVIVLADETWHRGVVGICCSRLVETFGRPTILMQIDRERGLAFGSGRSVPGFSLYGALRETSDCLAGFGGHEMAAGLQVEIDSIDALRERLALLAAERLSEHDLMPGVDVDCEAQLCDLDGAQVGRLERLEPFGSGNPRPRVLLRGVRAKAPGRLGRDASHLSFQVLDGSGGRGGGPCRAVWWRQGDLAERLLPLADRAVPLDLVVEPKLNHWRGRTSVEVEIVDACESASS